MRTKITTASLREMKRDGEKVVALTAYDHMLAGILDAAGIDVVLVGDSLAMVVQGRDTTVSVTMDQMTYHTSVVASAVKRALVVADMPFLSYQVSVEDALRNAGRLLKEGMAEAVKLEGGAAVVPTVRRLVDAGIPVMGHLGLTPQSINQFGTYKTRGTDPAEASQILADAHALADAGAFAVVLEKVPADLAAKITREVAIPTIGIGAGAGCDGQVLVSADMLGLFTRFKPRFVRRYLELNETIRGAVQEYCRDVRTGSFPSHDESY